MRAAEGIAAYKRERGLPVYDARREEEILRQNCARIGDEILREYYFTFQSNVMRVSRAYQERLLSGMKIAYGGTAGATLSLDARTGRVRIQRVDALDALADVGLACAFIAFADTAAAWKRIVADFRAVAKDVPGAEMLSALDGLLRV